MRKKIAIIGSTGSIGRQTLEVATHLNYEVVGLAAGSNREVFDAQVERWKPEISSLYLDGGIEGLCEVAAWPSADLVVIASNGSVALLPTLRALEAGKRVALATKEVLVMGGELVMQKVASTKGSLIPVDSEHSALFQCLEGKDMEEVEKLLLTSSGGPFRTFSLEQLANVTVEQALTHPNWRMGAKVTIDSSTLMNKGLEVIEAMWLFNLPLDKIEVVIHPQSIVHGLIEMIDGAVFAHLSRPTMLHPIQYALTYPDRKASPIERLNWKSSLALTFDSPDLSRFPCLALAMEAARQGGSMPACLNAANEALVDRFLKGKIAWNQIGKTLENIMIRHKSVSHPDLDTLLDVDRTVREEILYG